jgi:coatomer subunit gamma
LSEDLTEYTVSCIKHMYKKHIVFEFVVVNTVSDQELGDVCVKLEMEAGSEEEMSSLSPDVEIEIKLLRYDVPSSCYVSYEREEDVFATGSFTAVLKYTAFNLNVAGERDDDGDEDEYPLEELELSVGDYALRATLPNFLVEWEKLSEGEAIETFTLNSVKTLRDAVSELVKHFDLQPVDPIEEISPKKTKHIMYAAGVWISGIVILLRARMRINPNTQNVDLELAVRSQNEEINQMLASSV